MWPLLTVATGSAPEEGTVPDVLLALAMVLVGAKLLGALVERLGHQAVLGELLFGITLGNLWFFGLDSFLPVARTETFACLPSSARSCSSSRSVWSPRMVDAAGRRCRVSGVFEDRRE